MATARQNLIALLFNVVMIVSGIAVFNTRGAALGLSAAVFFVAMLGLLIYASKVFNK